MPGFLNQKSLRKFSLLLFIWPAVLLYSQTDSLKKANTDSSQLYNTIPVFNTGDSDSDSELDEQEVSSLLQSSRDVFVQFSVFQFAAGRYKMRGYPSENQSVLFQGVNVTNLETGYTAWNQWGGLNDISRFAENQFGNMSSRYTFSGPGGYVYIDSKASSFKKGTRISYAFGNRLFRHRIMLTHSTGLMSNGWAMTLSASWRYGDEVYIPGTYYNSRAFFVSIDKKLGARQLLNFTALSANTEQGRSGAELKEIYAISGSNYYNNNWGLQNGKVRNASVSTVNKPIFILSHTYSGKKQTKLNSELLYTFGKSGITALNWNDGPNPRPNYYRYLPSYYYSQGDTLTGDEVKVNWMKDVNSRQINWDKMIDMNRKNLFALPNEGTVTDQTRARYILENRVENLRNLTFNCIYNRRADQLYITAGLNANLYRNRKYKEMEDLLCATYWLDYDQFADNLGLDNSYQQNNIEEPDKKIYTHDRFGYDYAIKANRAEIWIQGEYSFRKTDVYLGMSLSDQLVWREGYVANGKFPNTSKGESEKVNFFNSGFKGGITYKINGRHYLSLNAVQQSRAPEINNMFVSPRTRNDLVAGIQNEKLYSCDLNYLMKYPKLKLRFTGYYTRVNDQTWLRSYWHDAYNNNVNLVMTNLDQTYSGIEIGIEKSLFTDHQLQGAVGIGKFMYANRPDLQAWQDNNNTLLYTNRSSYLKNYYVGGCPQTVLGLGYRYISKQHWFAGLYANYFAKLYVDINPERRTEDALDKYISNETQYTEAILKQEQLPSYGILNLNGGKSFRFKKNYYLNLNLVVYNILNNTHILTGGYEQLRWDKYNLNTFGNKYSYMQGTTFMLNVSFTFN